MSGHGVLLAESDRPTRAGLRVVMREAGFEPVLEAGSLEEALAAARERPPDAALIAADLSGGGLETVQRLLERHPGVRAIVLSSEPGGEELLAAVLAGAVGYLPKSMQSERLPSAVRGVLAGEVAVPRAHSGRLLTELRRRDATRERIAARTDASLTDREWEILQLLGQDAATAEIAARLRITQTTVRRHISTLVAKLGVKDRAAAARLARRSRD